MKRLLWSLCFAACTPTTSANDAGNEAGFDASVLDALAVQDVVRDYTPMPFAATPATRAYCRAGNNEAIEARITGLLSQLSVFEKNALLYGAALGPVSGTWQVRGNDRLGIPGFRMLDGPRGVTGAGRRRATVFPVAMLRGATWDPALEERVGAAMGDELLASGANVLLAPTMNILRHPRWGRAQETYSEDTFHMGSMAVSFIRGVQSRGVLACAKHFAANSIENTRHEVDVRLSERTLREQYLPHFRRAVEEAQVASVMSAYNRVNGLYADQQAHLLTDILRNEWNFSGFVVSDWVQGTHSGVQSLRAGLDIEMPVGVEFRVLTAAVADGTLTEAELDRSVRRVLRAQFCYGLDTRVPREDATARETPAHLALAREAARRGIVLLKNTGPTGEAPVLPLDPARVRSIAVLGRVAALENIGDRGSSAVMGTEVVTALEGLQERAGANLTVTHVQGTTLDAAGMQTVQRAEVVLVFTGNTAMDEGEAELSAGDRASMALPAQEIALIQQLTQLHPRVVVVLEGGSAIVSSEWDENVRALLWAGYPGAQGGRALADVLFGTVEPTGRLPFSVPHREAELPVFDNRSAQVEYGFFHGYRHLQQQGNVPRFAFGYGLGYGQIRYDALMLSESGLSADGTLRATVTLSNPSRRKMLETVQLYVAMRNSTRMRAPMDLQAFSQVEVLAGATVRTTLELPIRSLAVWNEQRSAWEVEPGMYEVRVGSNAEDTPLRQLLQVQ